MLSEVICFVWEVKKEKRVGSECSSTTSFYKTIKVLQKLGPINQWKVWKGIINTLVAINSNLYFDRRRSVESQTTFVFSIKKFCVQIFKLGSPNTSWQENSCFSNSNRWLGGFHLTEQKHFFWDFNLPFKQVGVVSILHSTIISILTSRITNDESTFAINCILLFVVDAIAIRGALVCD